LKELSPTQFEENICSSFKMSRNKISIIPLCYSLIIHKKR
jgi:hypothetical protein